jgi:hypothetical protein
LPLDAVALHVLVDLIRHCRRLGPTPGREDERERAVEADLLDQVDRLAEVVLCLAREADDQVGCQRKIRDGGTHIVDELQVALPRVRAAHPLQEGRRARLERQVRVLADGGAFRHRLDQVRAEVLGVRAREADALDAVHGVAGPQELGEPCADLGQEITAVRVHVLAQQRDLAHAVGCERGHLGDDVPRPPRLLAAAHSRNDAVRALRVTPHRDLHPGLERALASGRQIAGELGPLGEAPSRDPLPVASRSEPVGQVTDRARPERDVDERVPLEDPLPLRLRVAAADGDHPVRIMILQRLRLSQVRGQALVGFLADGAGVEDDDVGRVLRRGLSQPDRLEQALDPLGIVGVHLATERRYEVPLHGQQGTGLRS